MKKFVKQFLLPLILLLCGFSFNIIYSQTASLSKSPEKALKESTDNLKKIEEKIEIITDKKKSLEKQEKAKKNLMNDIEQSLVYSNRESRKVDYGIKYTDDFIRNMEKQLQEKESGIEDEKMKLNAKFSELAILSFNKSQKDLLSFIDHSDEYLFNLRKQCRRDLEQLRKDIRLYDQLAYQLSEIDKSKDKFVETSQTVQKKITEHKQTLLTSQKDLKKIYVSKQKAQAELNELIKSQKKMKSMIQTLQKKLAEQQKQNAKKQNFKFTGVGTYPWPVQGKILRPYIPDKTSGTYNPGIDIEAAQGSRVDSVAPGIVLFAGFFTGYGNLVIIDHGNDYSTLYSYLNNISVKVGQQIRQGEKIGSSGIIDTIDETGLHFEIRQSGESFDPGKWLTANP